VIYSLSMTNVDRILAEAMKLSDEERATLSDRLLEIVPEVPDAAAEQAWLKEALRRRAEWKAGRVKAVPGEEALTQMFAKP
jgi:putative addiction module component (TIGR02574 family)